MTNLHIVNPSDKNWTSTRWVILMGAYGWTRCLVWANSLDSALDEAIDWAAENAPGLLCNDLVQEAYDEAIADGHSEEKAWEIATEDTTCGGNCGDRILSHEWSYIEAPDRETLIRLRDSL